MVAMGMEPKADAVAGQTEVVTTLKTAEVGGHHLMWLSPKIFSILEVAKDAVDNLHAELAAVKAERDAIKSQLTVANTNLDWMRTKINGLEMERAGLIERAYQIKLPAVPQMVRTSQQPVDPNSFSFEDIGNDMARALGMPIHGDRTPSLFDA